MNNFLIGFFVVVSFASSSLAEDVPEDGRHDAYVKTDSGRYRVPVEVENGEVTKVHWPNGGNMNVRGADIEGGEAIGRNSEGDRIKIEIE